MVQYIGSIDILYKFIFQVLTENVTPMTYFYKLRFIWDNWRTQLGLTRQTGHYYYWHYRLTLFGHCSTAIKKLHYITKTKYSPISLTKLWVNHSDPSLIQTREAGIWDIENGSVPGARMCETEHVRLQSCEIWRDNCIVTQRTRDLRIVLTGGNVNCAAGSLQSAPNCLVYSPSLNSILGFTQKHNQHYSTWKPAGTQKRQKREQTRY